MFRMICCSRSGSKTSILRAFLILPMAITHSAGSRDGIQKSCGGLSNSANAIGRTRRSHKKNRVESGLIHRGEKRPGLFHRKIGCKDSIKTCCCGITRELLEPVVKQRVVIAHDEHRNLRRLSNLRPEPENVPQGRPRSESTLCRPLDYRAISNRVGKGNTDFDDVCAGAVERENELRGGFQVRVAGRDERNEGLSIGGPELLELVVDSGHE